MKGRKPDLNKLVAGCAGFIGSQLVEKLLGQGSRVSVIDNLTSGSFENLLSDGRHSHIDMTLKTKAVIQYAQDRAGKLRILALTPFFLPSEGGGVRAVYYLSREYAKLGHDVEIATFNCASYGTRESDADKIVLGFAHASVRSARFPAFGIIDGLRVYRFPYVSVSYPLSYQSIMFSPSMLSVLLRQAKPDVVHLHGIGWFYHYGVMAAVTKMRRIPLVITTHGLQEFYDNTYVRSPYPIRIVLRSLVTFTFRSAARIIALTKADIPVLSRFGVCEQQISTIPNGVHQGTYAGEVNGNLLGALREKYKLRKRVVLSVSVVKPSKGLEYLIEAVSYVNHDDMTVLIVGDHVEFPNYVMKLRRHIRKLALEDVVVLTGWLPDGEVATLYKCADVFVLPTLAETFGLVLLESMAAGKPIVATSVGGIPEIVENYRNGILVPPRDPEALGEAIRRLLDDRQLSERIGREGRRRVDWNYNWRAVAERTLKVYEEIMNTKLRR